MPALLSPYSPLRFTDTVQESLFGAYALLFPCRLSKGAATTQLRLNCHLRDIWRELSGAAETLDLILPPIQMECWAAFLSLFGF